ncbi:MAG: photosystem reaction center subunit H, partial [Planctomyces sp.]|nr:photosystem reaction center subunit H [Planctomyces sp.]
EQLEGAEGFDEDNWPTFNEAMMRDLNKRYKVNQSDIKVEDGKVKLRNNRD